MISQYNFCPECGGKIQKGTIAGVERPVYKLCSGTVYLDPKVASCALVEDDGEIILVRRGIEPALGKWTFPGGYIDRGEGTENAAIRQTKEEANIDVRITSLLGVYSYPNNPVVVIVYIAEAVGGNIEAGPECLEIRKFQPANVPWDQIAFKSTEQALLDWIKLRR